MVNKNMKFRLFLISMTALLLFGCKNNEPVNDPARVLSFDVYQAGSSAKAGMRRVHTDGATMTTTFTVGDKAGVFAIKDGQILPAVNNLCLTLNSSGVWTPARIVAYDAQYESAVFYAYFPYSESVTFNPAAANPFEGMVSAYPIPADQSNQERYAAADLMCSNACVINELHAIRLPMQHQMALLSIQLPNRSYSFTNENIAPYVIIAPENEQFVLSETEVKPFFDDATQSYLLIVRPETTDQLHIAYDNAGENFTAEITNLSDIFAGEFARYTIHGGAQVTTMTLQVGDYFLSDGTLLSKDASDAELTAVQASIIGVVSSLGTTEAITNAKSRCTHACVLSVTEQRAAWGTVGSTSSDENAAGWRYWYQDLGFTTDLSEVAGVTKPEQIDQSLLSANGYENTLAWRAVPVGMDLGGYVVDINSVFAATDQAFLASHPTPNVTTTWFIPSLKEWTTIRANADALSASLTRISATGFQWNNDSPQNYWSSNIRSAAVFWGFTGIGSSSTELFKTVNSKTASNYRYMLAF